MTVPETRLIRDENGLVHFAIKRFDREATDPNQRIHIQTYAALAGINYQEPTSDYEDLLRIGSRQFNEMRQQIEDALGQWSKFAKAAGLGPGLTKVVESSIQSMTDALR